MFVDLVPDRPYVLVPLRRDLRVGQALHQVVIRQQGAVEVKFFVCDNALAFKASIPRPIFQGDLLDSDNHGGQQYASLMDIEVPGM
jgi:Domain of unknown function (DUF4387)